MNNYRIKHILNTSLIPLFVATAALSLTPSSKALTTISLSDTFGDPTKLSISAGDSFTIKLQLNATVEQLIGTTYSIIAPGASSGKFTLINRSVVGTLFSDLTASNVSNTNLTDSATVDLGGLVVNLQIPAQPGSLFLADYTILSDAALQPGIYYLQAGANSVALDSGFTSIPLSTSTYQVTVVPEPGSAALMIAGIGAAFATFRRRKRN